MKLSFSSVPNSTFRLGLKDSKLRSGQTGSNVKSKSPISNLPNSRDQAAASTESFDGISSTVSRMVCFMPLKGGAS